MMNHPIQYEGEIGGRHVVIYNYANGNRYFLTVNGVDLGMTFNEKLASDPVKWVEKQLRARSAVITRNISRLHKELSQWETEQETLNLP